MRAGKMDASELKVLLVELNEKLSPDDFQALMANIDKDHSGFIGRAILMPPRIIVQSSTSLRLPWPSTSPPSQTTTSH